MESAAPLTATHLVRIWPAIVVASVLLLGLVRLALAQEGAIVRVGKIDDDVFAAGTSVDIRATIQGDAFVAGGWVDIAAEIADNLIVAGGLVDVAGRTAGDLIVAGGALDLAGQIGDNVVATGGSLEVDATIERKLFALAGRLKVGALSHVKRDAWLTGGIVDVAGAIEGSTAISAGRVTLRGRFAGDVKVRALTLTVTDGAEIAGNLTFYGPEPPQIDEGVVIRGDVVHEAEPPGEPASAGAPVYWLVLVAALGLLLDALLPGYGRQASRRLRRRPLASLGLGAAVLITTPVLVLLLFLSVLASALGLAAIALYGTLLLVGPVIAVFAGVDLASKRLLAEPLGIGRRRIAFLGGLILLGLVGWLPFIGTPLMWLVSVTGMGAASWQLYDAAATDWGPEGRAEPTSRKSPAA